MEVILLGPESCPYADVLRAKLITPWELRAIAGLDRGECSSLFATADALVSSRFDEHFVPVPKLKLLQAPATGINSICIDAVPAHIPICNSYGHQIAIAEYVTLSMLACVRDFVKIDHAFRAGNWLANGVPGRPLYAEIYGKTVCIIGLGKIGRETARRAKAFGMRVIGCNRTTAIEIPDVDVTAPLSSIAGCASQADFVVVACALTDETRSIVNGQVFRAMKKSAFIINVARGPLIEERELYHALSTRQIAGAVLDAWYRYPSKENPHPPPSEFCFSQLDNVIMTPHVSGWTDGMIDRRWAEIATNLDNLSLGKALINVVRLGRTAAST